MSTVTLLPGVFRLSDVTVDELVVLAVLEAEQSVRRIEEICLEIEHDLEP